MPNTPPPNYQHNFRSPQHGTRVIAGGDMFNGDGRFGNPSLGPYVDSNYTTNLCTNPSFETSLAGWTATDVHTSILQVVTLTNSEGQQLANPVSLYGATSMQVNTDGSLYNQGVFGPQGTVPAYSGPVIGSVTVSVFGNTGTLNISAVANPGGVTLATSTVVLNGTWQTIVLNNLLFPSATGGGQIYVLITTAFNQAIQFNVDGVMYQPTSPAHPYVDGDLPGCQWSGTAELSTSFQQYQFNFSSLLSFQLSGSANFVATGASIPFPAVSDLLFSMTPKAGLNIGLANPQLAMTDFGVWSLANQSGAGPGSTLPTPDPAQTYGWWTNSGAISGSPSGGYTQVYGMFVPPVDYPVSGGNYAWRRAAYCAVGYQWQSVLNNQYQILNDVQLEYARTTPGIATAPSAYQRPRQLQAIIKPNRLNYCTNPAMYNGITGWSPLTTEVLTLDTTQFPGAITDYQNTPFTVDQSLKISIPGTSTNGCQISVPFLIPGEQYICSFYCLPGPQMSDITGSLCGGSGDVANSINPADGYGLPPYGTGPYGGINALMGAIPQVWSQVSFSFIANSDTGTLDIVGFLLNPTYPNYFWITAVVIEPGDILNPYFDGYSGVDAMWETSGGTATPQAGGGTTPGLGRSYYYNQLQYGQEIVNQTLASNTPMGISAATPLYATPPTQ